MDTVVEAKFPYHRADGSYSHTVLKGRRHDGEKVFLKGRQFDGSYSDLQLIRGEPDRKFFTYPDLTLFEKGAGDDAPLLYRLPELHADMASRPDDYVFITEGEKDTETLRALDLIATTNSNGATSWPSSENARFTGRRVVVLIDNDAKGRKRRDIARKLAPVARSVRALELPGLPPNGDVTDWLESGNTKADLLAAVEEADDEAAELPPSEHAVAVEFTRQNFGTMLYDHDLGSWFEWRGCCWRQENTGLAFEYCRQIAAAFGQRAMMKASVAAGAERFARSDRAHAVNSEHWDRDLMLLATPGPTIDLRTGAAREPRSGDYITKLAGFAPESGTPELWLRCLQEWTGDDAEVIRFIQQFCGYCLTGLTIEHALLFAYGDGGNGKGVFMRTVAAVLGEYAMTAGMEAFTASKGDRHTQELARLRGARLVTASEVEEGKEFNAARVKQVTGGDPITARFMRQNDFTYLPQFKLLFFANDLPRLRHVDNAMRRRINMIPFLFKPRVVDPHLEDRLKTEGGRILTWMIKGCLDWQRTLEASRKAEGDGKGSGLIRPDKVKVATDEYFEGQDVFGQWIEDRCLTGPNRSEQPSTLYASWVEYARRIGEEPGTLKAFSLSLAKRFEKRKSNGIKLFSGIALASQPGEPM